MVDYPERQHFTSRQLRPLREGIVEALREAVIVVDVASPALPLILANAAARQFLFSLDADENLAETSLHGLLANGADKVIADARQLPSGGDGALTRRLTWRLPRGDMEILTELRLLDLDDGVSHPVAMLTFPEPKPKSVPELTVLAAIEQISSALLILDRNLDVTFANRRAARMAGSSAAGMVSLNVRTISPMSAVPLEAFTRAFEGHAVHEGAVAVRSPDAAVRWYEVDIHPLNDRLCVVGLALLVRETPRRPAHMDDPQKLPEASANDVDVSRDLVMVASRDAKLQFISKSVTKALGFSPDELLSSSLFAVVHPADRADLESRYADLCAGLIGTFVRSLRLRQKSAGYRWYELTVTTALTDSRIDGLVVYARDSQDHKTAQIALRNLTDWLKLSMGMAELHAWRWHRATDTLEFAFVDGHTVNLPEVSPGMRKLLSRVHPRDRPEVRRAIDQAFERHTEVHREFRLKARNGQYRHYSTIARPLFDTGNQPAGLVGVTQDVTSRHESQSQLRRSEELLRTTTAHTADTLILVDTRLVIRFINREVRGLGVAELIGREVSAIMPAGRREGLLATLRRVLMTGNTETVEIEFGVTAGRAQYFETRAVLVREEGIGTGISITVRDVTERKRMEQEILAVSDRERQAIGRDLHDGLGQELTGVALMLRGLATRLEGDSPETKSQVEEIVALVNRSIDTARSLARGLLPVAADRGGLTAALETLAERARELYGFQVHLRIHVPNGGVSESTANHLYRITQEALTNAARHAHASAVAICLRVNAWKFLLRISDDGVGIREPMTGGYGMGLKIMRYRASMINAMMDIRTRHPQGTVVCVTGKRQPSMQTLESVDAT
jgi:PAS domain S-box-containing protein